MLKHLETAQPSKLSKALDCVALRPVSATSFVIQYTNSEVMKCSDELQREHLSMHLQTRGLSKKTSREIGGGEWCKNHLAKLD